MAVVGRGSLAGGARGTGIGLRLMAICVGTFLIAMALNKLAWFTDSQLLLDRFLNWLPNAKPAVRWYLETIAIPAAPLFARLVPLGEFTCGIALIAGFWPRIAAALSLFMVLNFHFATASYWSSEFLRDGTGPPLIGALLALALNRGKLPFSIRD